MKQFSPQFAAHIAGGATTLCTCWRLQRTDGAMLGFTDHDQTISLAGLDYAPQTGFSSSEVAQKLGTASASTDLEGILDSAIITEADLELGRYRDAVVHTYWVNWRDPQINALMSQQTIGTITRQDGYFRAELRSAQSDLARQSGRFYQSVCGTLLGSAECGVNLAQPGFEASVSITQIVDRFSLAVSGAATFGPGWFSFGEANFIGGERQGLAYRIEADLDINGVRVLRFAQTMGEHTAIGDTLTIKAGCDRRFSTCRQKFANQINFRGFPHIPGNDYLLTYPKQGDSFSGEALVK